MSDAQAQIDRALRLAQDEAERTIAWFRLGAFSVTAALSGSISAFGPGDNPLFPALLAGSAAVALCLLLAVNRLGATTGMRLVSTLADLCAPATIFYFGLRREVESGEVEPAVMANLSAAMFLIVLVVSLRSDRWLGLLGGVGSAAAFVLVVSLTVGLHPFYFPAAALLLLGGGVAGYAATRSRAALTRFARLQLLERFLPAPAVERVLRGRLDQALSVGGQEVTLTILCADLRGFTALSEGLAPAEVVEQLNAYHAVMLEAVTCQLGVLDKFIGDGMLAHFGLRTVDGALGSTSDQGAAAAFEAAQQMLQALEGLNRTRAARGRPPFRMGIGLHTGTVVAGNIGAPGQRMEFTIIGDAVNVAARLEAATKELGEPLALSGATVERLPPAAAAHLRPLGPLGLRGRTGELAGYGLVARPAA